MTTASRLPAWARPKDMLDLTRLAVPVAISRASFMLMSLTDAVLLGRYAPGELPFVLNGWLPIGVLFGFGMGLMIGVQVLTAELNGAGRPLDVGRSVRQALYLSALTMVVGVAVHPGMIGGTRIAASLQDFARHHARAQLNRGSRVWVFSDGFDTDGPELLATALQEVRARGARITWFHPTRQVPAAAALQKARSLIERFVPLATLADLAAARPVLN